MLEDLIDMSQYPSLQTTYTESDEAVDLSLYFDNLGRQVSEEEVKTQLDESISESFSSDVDETDYSQFLNPPVSDSDEEES